MGARWTVRAALAGLTLLSCLSCAGTGAMGGDRLRADLRSKRAFFTDRRVEELEALRPERELPFRLAVAPPIRRILGRASWRTESGPAVGAWTPEERAVLERSVEPLRARGVVSDLVFLPALLVDSGGGQGEALLSEVRQAAARQRADAVLLVHSIVDTGSYETALALLDLTLVGMILIPGHEVEARTALEALIVDVGNEYLYATAEAGAFLDRRATRVRIERHADHLVEEVQLAALENLGAELARRSDELIDG